jgi:hypothetical protein
MTLDFKVEGMEEIERAFAQAPQVANAEMKKAMTRSVNFTRDQVKLLTPVFQQDLRNSIVSKVEGVGLSTVGRIGSKLTGIYPSVMELGRKPTTPEHQPPYESLMRWVEIKIHPKNVVGVAIAVAKSIGRKGIKGHFMFRDGLEKSKTAIIGFFDECGKAIAAHLGGK